MNDHYEQVGQKINEEIDKNLGKSKTAAVIALVSVIVALGAIVVGIAMGFQASTDVETTGQGFSFGIAAVYWVGGIIFGVFGCGFAKIITLLTEIRDKKWF